MTQTPTLTRGHPVVVGTVPNRKAARALRARLLQRLDLARHRVDLLRREAINRSESFKIRSTRMVETAILGAVVVAAATVALSLLLPAPTAVTTAVMGIVGGIFGGLGGAIVGSQHVRPRLAAEINALNPHEVLVAVYPDDPRMRKELPSVLADLGASGTRTVMV